MRERLWSGLLSVAMTAGVAACSPSSSAPPTAPMPPGCPTSYAAANGAACATEAQSCDFIAPCGAFGTPATCVCTGGAFVCTGSVLAVDGSTSALPAAADASTLCVPGATPPACPPTERLASIASCTAPRQQCFYPSACASIPAFDTCQCVGDVAPHFDCIASCEVGDATAPDAHVTDATAPDDGRAPDAATDAASPDDGRAPASPLDGASEQ
jgi:hypothetical protein